LAKPHTPARRPLVVALALTALLTACDVSVSGSGAVSGTAVTPDRETTFDLESGSTLTLPPGAVSQPGLVTASPVDPPADPPEGLEFSGPAYEIVLRGTSFAAGGTLSLATPPKGQSPEAVLLGRFEPGQDRWLPVRSTYGGDPARLTGTVQQAGMYAGFRVDVDRLATLSRGLLDRVLAESVGAVAPVCQGDLAANRITVETSEALVVGACVGVRDGAPELAVVGDRGSIVAADIPTRWSVEPTGTADPALQAVLDLVSAVPLRPAEVNEGRTRLLLAPGLGLRLGILPNREATLRLSPDARATVATGIDYAVDVMTTFTLKLAWFGGVPDPGATAGLLRTAFATEDCATQLAQQTRQPVQSPEQIGRLFRTSAGLGVACLAGGWTVALGRDEAPTDPLTATMRWLVNNVDLVFTGPTTGPALNFPNLRIEVTQAEA